MSARIQHCASRRAIQQWKGPVATSQVVNSFNELFGMDGESIELEWKKFT